MTAIYNRLRKAILQGEMQKVKTILQLNPVLDVNEQNKSGWTVLMYAAWLNRSEIVNLLIDKGADIHLKDAKGDTALAKASDRGCERAAQVLQEVARDQQRRLEETFRAAAAAERQAQHDKAQKAQAHLRARAVKFKLRAGPQP